MRTYTVRLRRLAETQAKLHSTAHDEVVGLYSVFLLAWTIEHTRRVAVLDLFFLTREFGCWIVHSKHAFDADMNWISYLSGNYMGVTSTGCHIEYL